jgi:hypothetical protein
MAERRRREDEAPRLIAKVPKLDKLRLEILERSSNIARPEHTHVRHVVVIQCSCRTWFLGAAATTGPAFVPEPKGCRTKGYKPGASPHAPRVCRNAQDARPQQLRV